MPLIEYKVKERLEQGARTHAVQRRRVRGLWKTILTYTDKATAERIVRTLDAASAQEFKP